MNIIVLTDMRGKTWNLVVSPLHLVLSVVAGLLQVVDARPAEDLQ